MGINLLYMCIQVCCISTNLSYLQCSVGVSIFLAHHLGRVSSLFAFVFKLLSIIIHMVPAPNQLTPWLCASVSLKLKKRTNTKMLSPSPHIIILNILWSQYYFVHILIFSHNNRPYLTLLKYKVRSRIKASVDPRYPN